MSPETQRYFERFGFHQAPILPPQGAHKPLPNLGMVVVIPCHNEPDLIPCLESLRHCRPARQSTEVWIVINESSQASPDVRRQNRRSLQQAQDWIQEHSTPHLRFFAIPCFDLPPKHAGVGLARKLGLDEGLRRLDTVGRPDGVLVCYDADCGCDPDYLKVIEQHFADRPESPGGSIHFEHPLTGPWPLEIYEAITAYELHLRYYVQAQRYAGLPYAFHTVGSSMAFRADAYRKQGGMNKRQAGEDFYFLHKIIALGNFTEVTGTCVFPSPRPSDRVPFGTGRAVQQSLDAWAQGNPNKTLDTSLRPPSLALPSTVLSSRDWRVERESEFHSLEENILPSRRSRGGRAREGGDSYPWQAFQDIRTFIRQVMDGTPESFPRGLDSFENLSEPLGEFLAQQSFDRALTEMKANTASAAAWRRRFFVWWDAFRTMKYVHYARDHAYGSMPIGEAAKFLLKELNEGYAQTIENGDLRKLLFRYRTLQRGSWN